MRFYEKLNQDDISSYSLNFLLAEFEEITDLDRDLKIISTKVRSEVYQTNDFKPSVYYKHISAYLSDTSFSEENRD